jgi:hypothetical protein
MTKTEVAIPKNIHQRIHAVMQDVAYIQKDRNVGNYKVVSHDAVTAKVRPVLVKHGVIYYPQNMVHEQNGNRTEVTMDIVFVNVDEPNDKIAVPTFGYGIDASDKGPGKAVSYAVKMALLKALGLETGEDADDGTDQNHEPAPQPVKNAPGITEARKWVDGHMRELHASEDGVGMMATIAAVVDRWYRIKNVYPALWHGPNGSGLYNEARKVASVYQCIPEYDTFIKSLDNPQQDEA